MNRSRLKYILQACLLFGLFFYSWVFQVIPILLFNWDAEKIGPKTNVFLSAFASLVLAIILFVIYRKELISEWKKFKNSFWHNFDVGIFNWFIGLLLMVVFNTILSVVFKAGTANNEESVQSMISIFPLMMLIMSGLLAPWTEEIVFRKSIRKIFKKKLPYILVSGLLFGMAHVVGSATTMTDWLFVLPYGSLGVAFAASYYDTETIFTPIMFHMIHNILLVLVAIFL